MNDKPQSEFYYKFFNFDLDSKELLKKFNNTASAYNAMKKFFIERDFEHRQYSGYLSNQLLDKYDIADIAKELGQNFKWLKGCIQKADVLNVVSKDETNIKEQIYDAIDNNERIHLKNQEQERNEQIQRKHADLAKEIKNYTEHKSVFYADARKRIEDKIISLCVDLNTSGEIINPKDFEVFLNIVKERNNGRSL